MEQNENYGKFKSLDALLDAYSKLEAEFTKKCQRLKQLESDNVEVAPATPTPLYQRDDWSDILANFILKYPLARQYAPRIGKILLDEPSLAVKEEGPELALLKVLLEEYKTPEDMMKDEDFLNGYIYVNDEIKNKIIADYIASLEETQPPKLIARGGESFATPTHRPKTFSEASILAKKMLKKG